ncbi:uncharacterized protein K452DRAFT_3873 [Aplosporella prunicola CBS 121167]|uniref:Cora-domain-containing protein n=1 Tax=Aplosporella prunicola CBS 121167 TaxID=1176127 RepID=A0A6A6BWL3_9PEZI|nr:uncharacterized protein K452DRAFT_3873 [Aplosporella prunicola CBS 121167]KAF2147234.1 hypothetical protein K452DRAFT_3873 [Aplosporella prunicola CBS 121167]
MSSRDQQGESSAAPTLPRGATTYAQAASATSQPYGQPSHDSPAPKSSSKRKKNRGGKKRRRRQSFAAPSDHIDAVSDAAAAGRPSLADVTSEQATRDSFYRLVTNRSNTSLESEALLDHREQGPLRTRRQSIMGSFYSPRASQPYNRASPSHRSSQAYPFPPPPKLQGAPKLSRADRDDDEAEDEADDRTPLMGSSKKTSPRLGSSGGYGGFSSVRPNDRGRRKSSSTISSVSSKKKKRLAPRPGVPHQRSSNTVDDYDVNNPPSVPGSPRLESNMGFDDVMLTGDLTRSRSPDSGRKPRPISRDAIINIDEDAIEGGSGGSSPRSTREKPGSSRRQAEEHPAEYDVCFPQETMSEIGHEEYSHFPEGTTRTRRRRRKPWPNLSVLEEWATEEKEQRTLEGIRARKVNEPLFVEGRLRPQKRAWHREEDDAPFRFTYFNEDFESTLHSHTLSELLQEGQTFRELFIPDPPVLSDDSSSDEEEERSTPFNVNAQSKAASPNIGSRGASQQRLRVENKLHSSGEQTGETTPILSHTPTQKKPIYGARPVFWLDILSPTEAEMKTITRTFGIHPLTHEDVMMQEAREKVELFHNYYFVNYRTFEQDTNSEDYLEPVNIYFIVFREGVISIHFSMTPHMANVRRRIRQLRDYLILSSDWIAYAIIDDITDVYAPLIQKIEDEVDDIDDAILRLHNPEENLDNKPKNNAKSKELEYEKQSDLPDGTAGDSGGNMLRRVGETRKKVMALYRLLGNKADVIKGFAKRCNEQWEVAPKTEIGLYLGDIQDHIVTMTGNLSHYESLLSRAHGNYLAQINIRMNERAEQTNDVLGKLTVLGTIVLPMNIVTGMWGMNVTVPGQEIESLWWFWGITAGLILFGVTSFFICKRYFTPVFN